MYFLIWPLGSALASLQNSLTTSEPSSRPSIFLLLFVLQQVVSQNSTDPTAGGNSTSNPNTTTMATGTYSSSANSTSPTGAGVSLHPGTFSFLIPVIIAASPLQRYCWSPDHPTPPQPPLVCLNTPSSPPLLLSHAVQPHSSPHHGTETTRLTWMDSTSFFVLLK